MNVQAGPLTVDLVRHEVRVDGVLLTAKRGKRQQRPWRLLECLTRRAGEGVPYQTIAGEVLDFPDTGPYELKNLRMIRRRLVNALGPSCAGLIQVIPGWGMRLEAKL